MLRIPHCLDNRLIDGGKVVSPTHPPHFTPQKHYYFYVPGTHFCKRLSKPQGPVRPQALGNWINRPINHSINQYIRLENLTLCIVSKILTIFEECLEIYLWTIIRLYISAKFTLSLHEQMKIRVKTLYTNPHRKLTLTILKQKKIFHCAVDCCGSCNNEIHLTGKANFYKINVWLLGP
jgi:hypothetical protein